MGSLLPPHPKTQALQTRPLLLSYSCLQEKPEEREAKNQEIRVEMEAIRGCRDGSLDRMLTAGPHSIPRVEPFNMQALERHQAQQLILRQGRVVTVAAT